MQLKISSLSDSFVIGSAIIAWLAIDFFILTYYFTGRMLSGAQSAPAASIGLNPHNPVDGWSVVPVTSATLKIQTSLRLPVRLKIPKIHVDSVVEHVGLAKDGSMDVPKNRDDVAWLELAARPGVSGSAVIAGHYGAREGKGSAFDNLHKLRPGDRVYVEDTEGEVVPFVVREARRYNPKADPVDVYSSRDGKSHLNLITCEGVWDDDAGGYPARLVVFTDKVENPGEHALPALLFFSGRRVLY